MSRTTPLQGDALRALLWPLDRSGEALEALARRANLPHRPAPDGPAAPPAGLRLRQDTDSVTEANSDNSNSNSTDLSALPDWLAWASQQLGLEAEPVATPAADLAPVLRAAGPALWLLPADGAQPAGWLLLWRCRRGQVALLGPQGQVQDVSVAALEDGLVQPLAAPHRATIERLLHSAEVPAARQQRAAQAMLREHLARATVGACWLLRAPPGGSWWSQLRQAAVPRRLATMLLAFSAVYVIELLGWALIGQSTLGGQLDRGWFSAWALLLLTLVPLHTWGGWLDAQLALEVGRRMKSRLLDGILHMDLDAVRRQGAGEWLGRVMEAQALESLALNGGLSVLVALLELLFAASLLAHGAGGSWQLGALAAWLLLTLVLTARYVRRLRVWTLQRLALTHEMVEGMVGHRTRLAQEPAGRREAHDDALLRDYTEASQAMDRALLPTAALLPRGWLLLGLASLAPALVQGGSSAAALGVALGGVLLAQRALGGISGGLAALSRAAVAWQQVAPIFAARDPLADAAPRHFLGAVRPSTSASHAASATITSPRTPLVDASGLRFRHAGQAQDVVQGLDLRIDAGERILVQGPSGGGKSTLASLLVGLRRPQSGLLLLQGLDAHTLGAGWRQWVTEAPQFHDNHILSGTLAFNLLLGRDWPASADDLQEAAQLCDELGLGPLLARMPSGLMQRVGETGWQLSHGERSRIFLARALLQRAPLTVLDESFGALDPETLTQCLRCALQRCSTLMVIAHP